MICDWTKASDADLADAMAAGNGNAVAEGIRRLRTKPDQTDDLMVVCPRCCVPRYQIRYMEIVGSNDDYELLGRAEFSSDPIVLEAGPIASCQRAMLRISRAAWSMRVEAHSELAKRVNP